MKVAHLAETCNLSVAAHFLMELHIGLVCAAPNAAWLDVGSPGSMRSPPAACGSTMGAPSDAPSLGTAWDWGEIEKCAKARRVIE